MLLILGAIYLLREMAGIRPDTAEALLPVLAQLVRPRADYYSAFNARMPAVLVPTSCCLCYAGKLEPLLPRWLPARDAVEAVPADCAGVWV